MITGPYFFQSYSFPIAFLQAMQHDRYTLDELARQLGRDRREILKLANRGRIPGRKVGDDWQFHTAEITQWLEQEMQEYSDRELAHLETNLQAGQVETSYRSPIQEYLKPETIAVPLQARTKASVLEALIEVAGATWQIWQPASILKAVKEREETFSTALENGVAFPHPRNPMTDCMAEPVIAYGRTFSGIPFGAPKRQLTDIFFMVLCLDDKTHLQALARLGRLLQQPGFLELLRETDCPKVSYEIICEADESLG